MKTILFHVTPRKHLHSILDMGLLVRCARTRTQGVWLCDSLRLPWAVAHISKHHRMLPEDMSILTIDATDLPLTHIRVGVKVTSQDVPAKSILDVYYYATGEPQ